MSKALEKSTTTRPPSSLLLHVAYNRSIITEQFHKNASSEAPIKSFKKKCKMVVCLYVSQKVYIDNTDSTDIGLK